MIGVDVSSRSVKIVEVQRSPEPILKTLCWSSVADNLIRRGVIKDVARVVEALKRTMANCSPDPLSGREVVASIPEVQSFVRVLELPSMQESEIDEAVKWAIKRHIPFDLDRVYVDWELLAKDPRGQRQVLVGAAQRDVVDPLLAVLDALEFNVVALELEAQAVVRCLLPQDEADARGIRGVVVVDLGATATNVVFYDHGAMRYTASIQMGGDDLSQSLVDAMQIAADKAIAIKAEVDLAQAENNQAALVLRTAALDLAGKVERIVREMSVQLAAERRVRAVMLSGGGANLKGMPEVFMSVFAGVPVQLGNPLVNLLGGSKARGARLSAADALHFTTAIGLALRQNSYLS